MPSTRPAADPSLLLGLLICRRALGREHEERTTHGDEPKTNTPRDRWPRVIERPQNSELVTDELQQGRHHPRKHTEGPNRRKLLSYPVHVSSVFELNARHARG